MHAVGNGEILNKGPQVQILYPPLGRFGHAGKPTPLETEQSFIGAGEFDPLIFRLERSPIGRGTRLEPGLTERLCKFNSCPLRFGLVVECRHAGLRNQFLRE